MMSGYKISYKVSPIITGEFEAELVEITSVNSFVSEQSFCESLLD